MCFNLIISGHLQALKQQRKQKKIKVGDFEPQVWSQNGIFLNSNYKIINRISPFVFSPIKKFQTFLPNCHKGPFKKYVTCLGGGGLQKDDKV